MTIKGSLLELSLLKLFLSQNFLPPVKYWLTMSVFREKWVEM